MSKGKLRGKLQTTLRFLQKSASDYDRGDEEEALRMAVSLRVLFHETKGRRPSIPLLKHLSMWDGKILTSADCVRSLVCFIDLFIKTTYPPGVSARPKLQNAFNATSLERWWSDELVFKSKSEKLYFRKDVILTAANQDGGAHVDLQLEEFYEEIASGQTLIGMNAGGLVYPGGLKVEDKMIFAGNIHLALLRQFTHEVLSSAAHFKW